MMKPYLVSIEDCKHICSMVEAESAEEARFIAGKMYEDGDLDCDCCSADLHISVCEEDEEDEDDEDNYELDDVCQECRKKEEEARITGVSTVDTYC